MECVVYVLYIYCIEGKLDPLTCAHAEAIMLRQLRWRGSPDAMSVVLVTLCLVPGAGVYWSCFQLWCVLYVHCTVLHA